jgi:anaerobic magnesium-protoporphyrin IX monomethyl ester cyclase
MKIVICTTPIRPEPTSYPPFGSMALIQALKSNGYSPLFLDIDGLRPTDSELKHFFGHEKPDIVGISAVVSTAYAYTKRLCLLLRDILPNAKIVIGGNLAASAEIILRLCKADVCVIGEGELILNNLIKHWSLITNHEDYNSLATIKGISYINESDEFCFTGYEEKIPANSFVSPNWEILEAQSNIGNFIIDPLVRNDFSQDSRTLEPHRKGKMLATAITAKGCVARCTFCHRWDKGYRHWPIKRIIDNVKYLIDRYNVGFIAFTDENFGSDRRKLNEFIEEISQLDILYQVGGVRCKSVDKEVLIRLKESGCVALYYGMETGSQKMLSIMEKNTSLQQNLDAALWTNEVGLYTIFQLVLGMPGETSETIDETISFLKNITQDLPEPPSTRMSINYVQALPGTPVYEYARANKQIGSSIDDEENYLLHISDVDASDEHKLLNLTNSHYLTVQSWRPRVVMEVELNWYKRNFWSARPITDSNQMPHEDYKRGGYFNLGHSALSKPFLYRLASYQLCKPLRALFIVGYVFRRNWGFLGTKEMLKLCWTFCAFRFSKPTKDVNPDSMSLRKIVPASQKEARSNHKDGMAPLRAGR